MRRVLSLLTGLALVSFGVLGCDGGGDAGPDSGVGGTGGSVAGGGGAGGTGGSGGGAGGSTAAATELCTAICGRDLRCGQSATMSECLSECEAENGQFTALLKPAFIAQGAKCYPDLACDKSDDTCISAAVASVTPGGQPDSLAVSCQNRLTECHGEDTLAVVCLFSSVFNDQGRSSLKACLAKPCADLNNCISALVGKI